MCVCVCQSEWGLRSVELSGLETNAGAAVLKSFKETKAESTPRRKKKRALMEKSAASL